MNRNIFTTRGRVLRAAILNTAAVLLLIGGGVVLLLAYFDVLTK
ncbi:hypothetical protein UFOVP626_40 [uncultured Caudovirales phage]|uniref:Uncharacterized protein n=1 Tax=uncultured Caudovirales phage TaxID=2100421 RepID=A0A6J5N519_9CAUD|nr:hypothetical protein UFOVP626_40 [uncultured Caudovirales phage]CAB4173194.1 hypothetical protein UFOVP951_35 [uncultured Caudovirales phage]CAB4184933.1 hypothetical protein UFOVP1115_56 [uncultured Caudovirales phage]CAB4204272.1 hypothetical protein UFOVP1390_46 [uncultured Caudovirales phage]CAB5238504.1 hypothetical protein UFOVP1567_55 [uncultured Caudovirales phage]